MNFKLLLACIYEYLIYYYIPMKTSYFNFYIKSKNEIQLNHEERVYCLDFDDTIAYTQFPKIIKPLPYAIEVLKVLTKDPNSTIILWTCREGKYLQDALNFCELYGIKFDYVNENCKRNLDLYKTDCRKVSADIYIDDHSYQGKRGVEKLWHDWYFWMKENNMIEE